MKMLRALGRASALAAGALLSAFGVREVMFLAACSLVGWGLGLVCLPAAFIVPGLMLAYVAVFGVK